MSRIAKKPIQLPEKTEISVAGNIVTVKGPQGTLSRAFDDVVSVEVNGREARVVPKREGLSPIWGTFTSHLANMVKGVNQHYTKKLIVEGVGFKADVKGQELVMSLGFSHPVKVAIPKELKVTSEKNVVTVSGPDKELVGQFAAYVRSRKKPEPYKGKGIRYEDEVVRRKEGKKTT